MTQPKDLTFSDIVVDIDFHPQKDVIAAGTIEGQVILYVSQYSHTPRKQRVS